MLSSATECPRGDNSAFQGCLTATRGATGARSPLGLEVSLRALAALISPLAELARVTAETVRTDPKAALLANEPSPGTGEQHAADLAADEIVHAVLPDRDRSRWPATAIPACARHTRPAAITSLAQYPSIIAKA